MPSKVATSKRPDPTPEAPVAVALLLLFKGPRGSKESTGVEFLALFEDLPKSSLNDRAGAACEEAENDCKDDDNDTGTD